jgi:drug/metabolite transporter (DMT)-like permease
MAAPGARPVERRLIGVLLVLLSGVAIAMVPIAAKLAFGAGGNTLTVVTLRGVVGLTLTAMLMAASGQAFGTTRRTFALSLRAGLAHALVSYGFIGSVAHMLASLAVLVYSTHPVLLAVISHWRGVQRLTVRKSVLALAVLAALSLVLGDGFHTLGMTGIGLGMLASVSVCGMILFSARAQHDATVMQVNLYTTAVAVVVLAAVTTASQAWSLPCGTVGWLGLAGAGVGVTIGLLAFFASFRFISPLRATMISNIEPLLGILFAVSALGEFLDATQWAGVGLVIVALVLFVAPPAER